MNNYAMKSPLFKYIQDGKGSVFLPLVHIK